MPAASHENQKRVAERKSTDMRCQRASVFCMPRHTLHIKIPTPADDSQLLFQHTSIAAFRSTFSFEVLCDDCVYINICLRGVTIM